MIRSALAATVLLALLAWMDASAQSPPPGWHPPPGVASQPPIATPAPRPVPLPDPVHPVPVPPKHLGVEKTRTASFGGSGGEDFVSPCPFGSVMTGIRAREGEWIDAVAPVCTRYDWTRQTRGASIVGNENGGTGGHPSQTDCLPPNGAVVMIETRQSGNRFGSVGVIAMSCGDYLKPTRRVGLAPAGPATFGRSQKGPRQPLACPPPYVAGGLFGRSGVFVDRIGLLCVHYQYGTP